MGAISARQCLEAALEANGGRIDSGSKGAAHWISELIWREFYRQILWSFPRVCRHQPFNARYDIRWRNDEQARGQFAAWCQGKTGYPIIDAAMRQLNTTGWMHNRTRMAVAMFLTKDLLIDWRWGERYFMNQLVDADLANNNGGWQWSAATGTDAAPYFRIFNPVSQSAKFDPQRRLHQGLRARAGLAAGRCDPPAVEAGRCGLRQAGLPAPHRGPRPGTRAGPQGLQGRILTRRAGNGPPARRRPIRHGPRRTGHGPSVRWRQPGRASRAECAAG
ncbi:MAG: hypothetical protein KatS3mg103_0884 [Phycisphaerales bacterium]|nr:MAG: hypothetical protein KatS3mg103_0884 [Phycisphaerales bacterium]